MAINDRQHLRALLGGIDEARVSPASKLPGERELAHASGATRSSLREALGVLEALRLIERRPQSGIYLRPAISEPSVEAFVLQEALDVRSSVADYEQAQEARVIHEVEAVQLAARRRTPGDLAILHSIIERSRANLWQGRNLAAEDEAFHLALVAAAKNPMLLRIGKSLYLMTRSRLLRDRRQRCAIDQGAWENSRGGRATRRGASGEADETPLRRIIRPMEKGFRTRSLTDCSSIVSPAGEESCGASSTPFASRARRSRILGRSVPAEPRFDRHSGAPCRVDAGGAPGCDLLRNSRANSGPFKAQACRRSPRPAGPA
jgi:DNA-binding FadR family transcriptional regulator